jgi:dipeptidase E
MNIVAIGGGEIRDRETLPIDEFIVNLAGKESPKVLFVPTASGDDQGYCNTFDEIYGKELGCGTEHLFLLNRHKDRNQIQEMILSTDIIYVGAGNTLRMMKLWRKLGVDRYMEEAGRQGVILTGLSAGAICWHQWGHSDSKSFSGASEWSYIRVKGLGFLPGIFCPHLDREQRHRSFSEMIQKHGGIGIACDNNAGIWYRENKRPVVKCSKKSATVCLYKSEDKEVAVETFHCDEELQIVK